MKEILFDLRLNYKELKDAKQWKKLPKMKKYNK